MLARQSCPLNFNKAMFGTRTVKRGEWTLLLLRAPGAQPIAGGVLLLDLSNDRLYVRLRTDLWISIQTWLSFGKCLNQISPTRRLRWVG